MQIDELEEDPLGKPEKNPWAELIIVGSDKDHVKIVEISASRTLKINHSLSVDQEEQFLIVLRKHLDAFAWD